jgi:hypothetical protein
MAVETAIGFGPVLDLGWLETSVLRAGAGLVVYLADLNFFDAVHFSAMTTLRLVSRMPWSMVLVPRGQVRSGLC